MKISYIEFLGKQYPLCFSLSASQQLSEKFGSLERMQADLGSGDVAKIANAVNTVLEVLMKAGRIYVKATGGDVPPELPCKPTDLIDVRDGAAITAIFKAISDSSEREVETKSKNAGATSGE